ncbi:helix-turn-helix transcriptional regulator [Streptomyces sp. NPDC046716]|uniref:helix-turn-helix transcriptional regulator n=1 Tax=Streptomyces sp. NPDC046716 TaxID=3157093 RepID=UPI0033F1B88E
MRWPPVNGPTPSAGPGAGYQPPGGEGLAGCGAGGAGAGRGHAGGVPEHHLDGSDDRGPARRASGDAVPGGGLHRGAPGRGPVVEIARAARVSVRALQLAFRRHLETTPMRYLREVRLQYAHEELREAVPGQGVTSVSARWGFSTPSRFATLYRQRFGFPPVQTLLGERRLIPPDGHTLN